MKIYALTGGIAAGKSTVGRYFKNLKIPVIDADQVVHQLYRVGTPCYKQVLLHFGPSILNRNKQINRKKLAAIVINFPKKRKWLEQLIHPATITAIGHKLEKLAASGHALAIVEAALMLESGYYNKKIFDGLILVKIDEATQLTRLMKRNKVKAREADEWIKTQWSLAKKIKFADYIVDNSGNYKQTKKAVTIILDQLLTN